MKVFFGLTTTVSASKATGSSKYLMPALAQASISFFRIGREASDVGLAAAELLEAAARAGDADGDLDGVLLGLLEFLGDRFGDRVDGAGTVDLDAFVAKSEVAQWPLIGWLARRADTVFIERGSRKAAHLTHQHMLEALEAGRRLAIFPEGTTTAGDVVLPFHGALFQSAIDAAVPVHAVALSYHRADGTRSEAQAYVGDIGLMDCLLTVLRTPGLTARLSLAGSFTPPLPDRRHLAHHCHQAIAKSLAHPSDPRNRGAIPFSGPGQPSRNEAAINQ
jgi:1-acyl-sn-glycerol-3-phosphate acyltransferase